MTLFKNTIILSLFFSLQVCSPALAAGTFIQGPALIEGFTAVTSAAGTTTLTVASQTKQILTGSTTQIFVLPDATTLPLGRMFYVINKSTGTATVNANGGALVASVLAGQQKEFHLRAAGSAAGTWDATRILVDLSNDVTGSLAQNKMAALTASKAMVTDGSGFGSASTVTATELGLLSGVTGTLATTAGVQSLSNKNLSGNTINSFTSNGFTFTNPLADGSAGQAMKTDGAGGLSFGSIGVAGGGTGLGTLTANSLLVGNGTSAVTFVGPGSSGNVLTSNGTSWASAAPGAAGGLTGFRNRFINSSPALDTRNNGSSQTITAAAALAYTVDNWYAYSTGANVTGQRIAGTGVDQYNYQFTGAASVSAIGYCQRIEAANSYDLNNGNATITIRTSNSLLTSVGWQIWRATTTADTFGTLAAPTVTSISSGTFTVTSTMADYSTTVAIPAAATTGLQVCFTVGAQTSGTWKIANSQIEAGSSATAYERRPYGLEDELAGRYLPRVRGDLVNFTYPYMGSAATTTAVSGRFIFPTTARVRVTGVSISAAGDFKLVRPAVGSLVASAVSLGFGGTTCADISWTISGGTADQVYYLAAVNAGVIYFLGAEL